MLRHPQAVILAGLVFVLPFAPAFGQTRQPVPPSAIDEKELAKYLQKNSEQALSPQAIEGSIDPDSYLVGPGDILRVNAWGLSSEEDLGLSLKVTPEGKVIIPSVGVIEANNKTLKQVQDEVRQACAAKYDPNKVKITAHLTQLRMVRAHIYGEVKSPGLYIGTAIDRIAFYISEAEGWTAWADERHAKVRHLDGTVDTLDLSRLYQGGDLSQNLYIRGGDVIYFPRIELTDKTVIVDGDIALPGPHKFAENETVFDFLHRIEALERTADFKHFYLIRSGEKPARLNFFGNGGDGFDPHTTRLREGDRILIASLKEFVYVHGAVQAPGSFPYVVGYTASDYVGMAGGTSQTGSLNSVRVIHHDTGNSAKGPKQEVNRGDTIMVPESSRKKITDFLTLSTQIATLVIAAKAVGWIK